MLQRYVQMATEAGVPQAVFPEGGLSTDGRLRPPRLGLLDYMLRAFDPGGERDLVFLPVGINYDRVLEDRSLLRRLDGDGRRRPFYAIARTLGFIAANLWLMLCGRWYRFGYACVNFGRPVSMRDWSARRAVDFRTMPEEARRAEVEAVATHVMREVGSVVPILPVSLVATVFARRQGIAPSELELKWEVYELVRRLERHGAHLYVPRGDLDYAVGVGLRMLTLRRIVLEENGGYRAAPDSGAILAYYANAIEPLVAAAHDGGSAAS